MPEFEEEKYHFVQNLTYETLRAILKPILKKCDDNAENLVQMYEDILKKEVDSNLEILSIDVMRNPISEGVNALEYFQSVLHHRGRADGIRYGTVNKII